VKFKGTLRTKEIQAAFKKLPGAYEKNIITAQEKTAKEILKFMRIMAPGGAPKTSGDLKAEMYIQKDSNGLRISAEAAQPNKEDQIKAVAIHAGRTRGNRGTTVGIPFVGRARQLGKQKHVGRMNRALLNARKEVGLK
jgi:hypothetical protein